MADQITPDSAPFEQLRSQFQAEFQSDPILAHFGDRVDELCEPLWDWAQTIDEADSAFRLRQQGAAQLLEVIGPDRPFLVDSLLGACAAFGLTVDALFHPIVQMPSGQHRSLIQVHLPDLSPTEGESLLAEIELTLHDVDLATSDYSALLEKMEYGISELRANDRIDRGLRDEAVDFLSWLSREHFVFLGARDYTFLTDETGAVLPAEPEMVDGSNLGILRDSERNVLKPGAEPLLLTDEISQFLSEPEPIVLAKATLLSRVHRRVAADYVGVKHFDAYGRVTGETRFLGLYTSEAYNQSVTSIPLLRQRRLDVLKLAKALPGSHTEKAITNVLEGWPRDELFQSDAEELAPTILGAANLNGRPRVRLFARPDQFRRFVSVVTFVPKDAYDTALRQQIGHELEAAYDGELVQFEPKFVGSDLVRVLFEISLPETPPNPDLVALEQRLVEMSKTWRSRFRAATLSQSVDRSVGALAPLFVDGFTAGYRETFAPQSAMRDVEILLGLPPERPITLRAYRNDGDPSNAMRAKIYSASGPIALSDCVPIFERMGLFVVFESGFPIEPSEKLSADAPDTYWVHALSLRRADQADIDLDSVQAPFEAAFVAVWSGDAENDGFNGLVLNAGLDWREAALCRTLCAYRQQTGMDPARQTQIEALKDYPEITLKLIGLFATRFDPGLGKDLSARADAASHIRGQIDDALRDVTSLSHDRVLRRLADLIEAIQRTNFYQRDHDGAALAHISFKIATAALEDVPEPKPAREIFLASPDVEGVHCRFGKVARGGIRWSDRRDDFRTEVLGLVKAQQVKNSVIVPVGAKGGFFVKTQIERDQAEARQQAGVAAYKTFISGLLGLTDNLREGRVVQPSNTVIWDGEDPYLVVAADKGTARFSDIANGISDELGFWLSDAFASGGSAGYDHKAMGITARGAWEAVKRHFRERGKNIQDTPFSVIGIGDMSGDVFGNGMLLSKQIKLVAAFNHRHIFVDPDPEDPGACWTERKRLFDLQRSSWDDYDRRLISEGGGIFERSAKSIELTPAMKALLECDADTLTPDELIHLLLKTKTELLWFGGIGTYIKASLETDADADD
ncbi:MAG: NAD-glutamate dehydrogenase domain-containing protein, partial [Pseudomonadota bacterium]